MLEKYIEGIKNDRSRKFVTTALQLGAKIEVLSEDFRILKYTYKNSIKYTYKEHFFLNKKPSTIFTKNKEITKTILSHYGISVPAGIHADSLAKATVLMEEKNIPFPVVVKPIDAAKGLGVSVGVKNKKEIEQAIEKIETSLKDSGMKTSGAFMIEKMVAGNDFRVLVLKDKVIACVERIPAHIIGDGKSSVSEIIKNFNQERPQNYELKIDSEVLGKLSENGLSLDSVLESGKRIKLRENANISSGGKAEDKTATISDRFKEIAVKSASFLGLNYAGIDIMTKDIDSNNPDQEYFIIEVNGAPDYDIHEKPVVSGKGVDVTKEIVKSFLEN